MCRRYELEARAHELQACTFPGGGFARPIPPSRPQVARAEVVSFPAEVPTRTDEEADREGSKAA